MITYSDQKDFPFDLLIRLFEQAPWASGRSVEESKEMMAHTQIMITAWDGSCLVGCGRVLTDFVYRASIWDVIVDSQYQGRDIGTGVIHHILQHPTLQRVELFWLCTRTQQAFYESLGFSAKEQTGMVWDRKRHRGLGMIKK